MSDNTVNQVLAAARLLFQSGAVVEVRVPKARNSGVISGYFNDLDKLAEAVSVLEKGRYPGVYWTLNLVDPRLLSRSENKLRHNVGGKETTSDDGILRRCLLLVDCDPKRPTDTSSTEAQHAAALARTEAIHSWLLSLGWPEALRADSGNGGHLIYWIDLPNDKESTDLIKNCLKALSARFDDPEGVEPRIQVDRTVHNASRISKIYGTTARKGADTEERPHRLSHILHVPESFTEVTRALLESLAAQVPGVKPRPSTPPSTPSGPRLVRPEMRPREFLDKYGIRYRDPVAHDGGYKYTLYECPFDNSHKGKDAAVFDRPDGFGFKCFHNSCADRGWKEFRQLYEPDAYSRTFVAGRQFFATNPANEQPSDEEVPPDVAEVPVTAADVRAAVQDVIARKDLDALWHFMPDIALLSTPEAMRIKQSLADAFGRKFSRRDFDQSIRDERRKLIAGYRGDAAGLPQIMVNNRQMRDVVTDSLLALRAANDPPFLFVRSGRIVYVEVDERQRPAIQEADKAHVRGRLARAANYIRRTTDAEIAVPPPMEVVEDILSLPSATWGLPALEFVVEVPTLRPDGTVLSSPGYDPASCMLYSPAPGFEMEPIPEIVTPSDLRAAVALVDEAVTDFPFADERDEKGILFEHNVNRANFFGLLMTPIVRPAISGVVPMALIDAPQAGTGKSLLADLFAIITTGRNAAMMPFPRDDDEMRKSIGSTLAAGRALVCFDNIEGILQSPILALALTARDYETRILGLSENMIVANRACWLATGNNINPSGDMPRRCYKIRLDAKKSRPYQGRAFRHDNLLDWARVSRAKLLRSLLIIARAWYQRKVKVPPDNLWGSFEEWHKTVAGILRSAGIEGFLANLKNFLDTADDNAIQWELFFSEIFEVYRSEWWFAGKIADEIRSSSGITTEPCRFTLPDSMADVDMRKAGSLSKVLGKSLKKRLHMRLGENELYVDRQIDPHTKQSKWRVLSRENEDQVRTQDALAAAAAVGATTPIRSQKEESGTF